ncbi:hypothetical protein [Pseudobacteriovorax antillogorgiicola]|uniref:hypothetical protein n=1 Tax=Pseudobacteriovorax antillogorgiicola TaxID=1513793 RepID=UPI0010530E71|nr:hypothetical protein [Pseudobacteriovorax antillogorgiicola]
MASQIEFSSRRQGASEETVRAGYGDERVTKSTTPRQQLKDYREQDVPDYGQNFLLSEQLSCLVGQN